MKTFNIADGLLQGLLLIATIISFGLTTSSQPGQYYYLIEIASYCWGWHFISCVLHVSLEKKIPLNRYVYLLQIILPAFSCLLGVLLFPAPCIESFPAMFNTILFVILMYGLLIIFPLMILFHTFFIIKRMLNYLRHEK